MVIKIVMLAFKLDEKGPEMSADARTHFFLKLFNVL